MDSDKYIAWAEDTVQNDIDGKSTTHAQAAGILSCAYALIAIAKELQAMRQIMEKTDARVQASRK